MILLANFMNAIASILNVVLNLFEILLILAAIFSWFPQIRYNQGVQMVNTIVDKILAPIRKFMPKYSGFDLAFVIAFILIIFIQSFVVASLFDYAAYLKN